MVEPREDDAIPARAIRVVEGPMRWEIWDEGACLSRRRSAEAAMKAALSRAAVLFEAGVRAQVVMENQDAQAEPRGWTDAGAGS